MNHPHPPTASHDFEKQGPIVASVLVLLLFVALGTGTVVYLQRKGMLSGGSTERNEANFANMLYEVTEGVSTETLSTNFQLTNFQTYKQRGR